MQDDGKTVSQSELPEFQGVKGFFRRIESNFNSVLPFKELTEFDIAKAQADKVKKGNNTRN